MQITQLEQSGFIIETKGGYRIAVDIGNKTPIETLEGVVPVDLFVVSHIHGDHFHPANIAQLKPPTVILPRACYDVLNPGTVSSAAGAEAAYRAVYRIIDANLIISQDAFVFDNGEVSIQFFSVDHGPNVSEPVENLGMLIRTDDETLYFAGDMFYPSGIETKDLDVDHALIPIGTHYTFGPQEAWDFAQTFKRIGNLIPVHYAKNPEALDEFLAITNRGSI